MRAASEGHTDCVRELLSSGAVVDLADKVSMHDTKLMCLYRQHVRDVTITSFASDGCGLTL